ncbi:sulfotransferase [Phenylobacterium sp. J426]|uniref:sulfotransferase n=1 Tax=Phenylobacterium sp. J426 TaxID=2898439 RepID=UPI0021507554|nr:sulfotransferase [Phenylobacterium sp. J426]MCR5876538.1 sulfotransferase [Phenylobacterium sp. J426]
MLCCFGRGGSSVVWNLIGASPAALMMGKEWHQAAFASQRLPRLVRALHRSGRLPANSIPLRLLNTAIARTFARRAATSLEPDQLAAKPDARGPVVKLMDYHLLFLPAVAKAQGPMQPLVLCRNPLAQAEGLMRSGLSAAAAAAWCDDVLRLMHRAARQHGAPVFRFEDLIADPAAFTRRLYEVLSLPWPHDGRFRLKAKGYGAERLGDIDVGRAYTRLSLDQLEEFLDPAVNVAAIGRLSDGDRRVIRARTADAAALFGYDL